MLSQYSASYPAAFYLFTSDEEELAGPVVNPPSDVMNAIHQNPFAHTLEDGTHMPGLPEPYGGTVECRNRSPKGFEVETRLRAADAL